MLGGCEIDLALEGYLVVRPLDGVNRYHSVVSPVRNRQKCSVAVNGDGGDSFGALNGYAKFAGKPYWG